MDPLLHIGFAKTGSTWFQTELYPKVRDASYVDRVDVCRYLKPSATDRFDLEASREFFARFPDRILVCEERLLGGNAQAVARTAERMKAVFPSAQIVILLRNQLDMFASRYLQYVKGGGTYDLDRFLYKNQGPDVLSQRLSRYRYEGVLELYHRLFGRDNVHVFLFEAFRKNNETFIREFQKKLELQVDGGVVFRRKNVKYRTGLIGLARAANHFSTNNKGFKHVYFNVPHSHRVSKKLLQFLNRFPVFGAFPTTRDVLGEGNYQLISEYFAPSNRILLDSYGLEEIKQHRYPL